MIVLATVAAVIASQAIISGAFSLTMQAVQLGFSPRLDIRHTSEREYGQIYVPPVNWALGIATVGLVLVFQHSAALASAYGIAVTSTMLITSVLFGVVARLRWGWSWWAIVPLEVVFLTVEIAFFSANVAKLAHGGWLPLAVAVGVFVLMTTWRDGRRILGRRLREDAVPLEGFLEEMAARPPTRVRGNAVYMTGNPSSTPQALVKNLEHYRVLHFQVVLMHVDTEDVPHVPPERRVDAHELGNGFYRVEARYGFLDEPNAVEILDRLREKGLDLPLLETTFFLGRERLSPRGHGMARWRARLFGFMARNAQQATAYFRIPAERVVEVGSRVEL
jgi:KUP system potassium uptake protein